MTYHDEILTIRICRGQLACSLGEQGLKVASWAKLKAALERELSRETPARSDGHSGSCDVADLLLERIIEQGRALEAGLKDKPTDNCSRRQECWPFEEPWFTGQEPSK